MGWIDKNVSNPLLHSQSRQAVVQRYFKSWKSYSTLKKSGGVQKPKPPNKRRNYMTTRWKKSAIRFIEGSLFGKRVELSLAQGQRKKQHSLFSNTPMDRHKRQKTAP